MLLLIDESLSVLFIGGLRVWMVEPRKGSRDMIAVAGQGFVLLAGDEIRAGGNFLPGKRKRPP
jgi:hypothetical protein